MVIYIKVRQDAEDIESQRGQAKPNIPRLGFENDPIFLRRNFETNINTLSKGLVQFLRDPQHNPRPANIVLDLSNCGIWGQDVSNMDFRGVKVEGIWFYDSNLSGANFSGSNLVDAIFNASNVSGADFSDVQGSYSTWNNTAWWRAKRISPHLLQHLQEYYKFSEKAKYKDDKTKDYSEYQKEVERLIKSSGGAETAAAPQASPEPTPTETPTPTRNVNAATPREGNANGPAKRTRSVNSRNTNTDTRNAATTARSANRRPAKRQQVKRTRRRV